MRGERPYIPLNDLDLLAAKLLSGCTLLPGSYNKRFARDVAIQRQMTPKQYRLLWALCFRYRRQIHDRAVNAEATRLAALWPKKTKATARIKRKVGHIAPAFEGREDLLD
jgi:hypothetical protein